MYVEYYFVEENNIHVRTNVCHCTEAVAIKLHRRLREVISVPNEFSRVFFGNEDRECHVERETLMVGRKRIWRYCCSALLVLLFVGMLVVRISSPLLDHGACVYILCSVVAK